MATRWEYSYLYTRTEQRGLRITVDALVDRLNELGENGWELVLPTLQPGTLTVSF